ncbi:MAG: hypothetical protein ACLQVJ_01630 [Syntrophobacteraceae bacterium]
MNASRLREILDLLLEREAKFRVQEIFRELNQKLAELISQPQNPAFQSQFSEALEKLREAGASLRASIEPAQMPLLQEIGADKYFVHDFPADISASIRDNPISPAVTQQKLNEFFGERENYIQRITQLRDNLRALHIEASSLKEGDAEIGFLLPRSLFNNRLDQLIKELRDINRIIRSFSEATIGRVEEVEVRQISTSDPLFFFGLDPQTIAALGLAITWALNTWKQVEEIRRVKAETRKSEVLSEKEANEIFDKKIIEKIAAAIEARVDEIAKDDLKPGRVKEQRTDLAWALESILAHLERGMIVEVRFLLSTPKAVQEGDTQATAEAVAFEALRTIAPQLVFPKMEGPPILKLQPPPSPEE